MTEQRNHLRWLVEEWRFLFGRPRVIIMLAALIAVQAVLALTDTEVLTQDAGCKPRDMTHSNFVEDLIYTKVMPLRLRMGKAKRVALVTISEHNEPLSTLTNFCKNRAFLASVVRELDQLGAKVIAIDQSYSQDASDDCEANDLFRTTLQQAQAAVVVGQRSHERTDEVSDADCLIEDREFDFMLPASGLVDRGKNNVHVGLLRLNHNNLKIPLSWNIFRDDASSEDKQSSKRSVDGFAYVTAKEADTHVVEDWKLLKFKDEGEHPYASFPSSFDAWSAMDVLCNGPDKLASKRPEWGNCDEIPHVPFHFAPRDWKYGQDRKDGRVIVLGEHIDSDLKPFPGTAQFGMDLHASYIESLLQSRYMRTVPRWVDDSVICLFVLLGLLLEAFSVRRPEITQTMITGLMGLLLLCVIAAAICLLQFDNYYMPHLLLASISLAIPIVGYGATAAMFELSKRHERTESK